jgi:hypothetical protein
VSSREGRGETGQRDRDLEVLKVVEEYTIKGTLEEPLAGVRASMSSPGVSIYESEATEAAGDQVGNGSGGDGWYRPVGVFVLELSTTSWF